MFKFVYLLFLFNIYINLELYGNYDNEEPSNFYPTDLYSYLWPDFCLEHLQQFPHECSEHCIDTKGNVTSTFFESGSAESHIDTEIFSILSQYLNQIPLNNNECDFYFCKECHSPVVRNKSNRQSEDDDFYNLIIVYRCKCLCDWFDFENYDCRNDWNYRIETEHVEENWIRCGNRTIPSSYFDVVSKHFVSFLEQHLKYCKENPECCCYWPYISKKSCEISNSVYRKVDLLLKKSFLNNLRYQEDSSDFSFLKNRTYKGVLDAFFTHSFFYSQYRQILLLLAKWEESNDPNVLEVVTVLNSIYRIIDELQCDFLNLYSQCLEKHPHPKIYYERGMIYHHRGEFFDSIWDIKKLFNCSEENNLEEFLTSKLYFQEGQAYVEQGLYDKALKALTKSIQKDPQNKEAYFERAQAYFELGKFDEALNDYLNSDYKITPIDPKDFRKLNFAKGLIKGTMKGGGTAVLEFVPSLLSTMQGLGNGLWSFVTNPLDCSVEIVDGCYNCIKFIKENETKEILETLVPELRELIEGWNDHNDKKKGELFGYIIGKYGTDILITAGTFKALRYYKDLKKANAVLTLEKLSKDSKKAQAIKKASNAINKAHLESVKKFKKGAELLKPYKGHYLPENQIRKILHQAGFETFPKPKGIPKDFKIKLSKKPGGMKYINPNNPNEYIRIMPGKPHSPNVCQQKPYVNLRGKEGLSRDKFGKIVANNAPEAHIPLDEFIYLGE